MEMGYSKPLFFFHSVLPFFATLTFAADPDLRADCIAAAGNYTANSAYQTNLNSIFYRLTSQTEFNYGFYNLSDGENPNKVNAIALCRGDRNQDECKSCLNETISELRQRCPFNKEVIGWHEYCTLRYANRDIFGDMEISPDTCLYKKINVSNVVQFFVQLDDLLSNLIIKAAAGGLFRKYATGTSPVGDSQTVYALAQCTPDLSKQECGYCLSMAKVGIGGCCSRAIGCTALRPSCFMRFESTPFYQTQIPSTPSPTYSSPPSAGDLEDNKQGKSKWIPIGGSLLAIFGLTLLCSGGVFLWRRKNLQDHNSQEVQLIELGVGDDYSNREFQGESGVRSQKFPSIQLDILQTATKQFCDENKLGQGGFGPVYKNFWARAT